MKTLIIISGFILLIVVGLYWFVNSAIDEFDIFTKPLPEVEGNTEYWSFGVIGDTEGLSLVTQTIINAMAEQDLEFAVHLGDIAGSPDSAQIKNVMRAFDKLPYPVHYIPGNNDLSFEESTQEKTTDLFTSIVYWDTYRSLDEKNAHIVLLDNSYRRYGFYDEELEWLREDLDNNTQEHTFLFYHRPIDLPGEEWFGDDETTYSRGQNKKFIELISNYEINRIFNGHLHTTLSYAINNIPVTISGGGGGKPQKLFGGEKAAVYHFYIVHVPVDGSRPAIEIVEFR
ncbi:MAG: metallophosphoesterase [Candidatus Kerfeldbacteria bacterium]